MPLGFGRSILSKPIVAAAGAGTGYFQSEYDGDTSEGAYNLIGDRGSGNTWSTDDSYSVMFWFKGTTADIANGAWTVMRMYAASEQSHTVTMNSNGLEPIIQGASGVSVVNYFPGGTTFADTYLDDEWHHCAIEFKSGAISNSEIWLDGDKKTLGGNGVTSGGPSTNSRYFTINGTKTAPGDVNGTGTNFRASSMQIADFWYKSGDNNAINLDSNMSTIYSSGWQDLGTDGTASSTLPTPQIWLYVDSDGDLQNGGTTSATFAEQFGSGTGGNWIQSGTGGPE